MDIKAKMSQLTEVIEQKICKFFLPRKSRYCRMYRTQSSDYCADHACKLGIDSGRKRIPCPLNPSHNIYEENLHSHLRKCNIAKLRQATEQSDFFLKGVNKGTTLSSQTEDLGNVAVCKMTSKQLADLIEKVKQLYKVHVQTPETVILEHPSVKVEHQHKKEDHCDDITLTQDVADNRRVQKELLQQASLIGQLDSLGLLSKTAWFVELGAGRGTLSYWLEKATNDTDKTSFLLVDRNTVRYKMERLHKDHVKRSNFKRLRVDIADLCLGNVSDITDRDSVVVISKHLCGAATDLGIRCAVDSLSMHKKAADVHGRLDESQEPSAKVQKLSEDENSQQENRLPHGVMIALCCHHQCDWDMYVGKEFMQTCGVSSVEFDGIKRLSSWATCARSKVKQEKTKGKDVSVSDEEKKANNTGDNKGKVSVEDNNTGDNKGKVSVEDEDEDHSTLDLVTSESSNDLRESLSVSAREEIGRMCKRLIDTGRLHYMRSKGMKSFLRTYVSEDITPENVVLLAHQTNSSQFEENKS